jgi:DNA-binding transcriptional regulator YiaG
MAANGFHVMDTEYGKAVSIEDMEGLHRAIATELVEGHPKLTGKEFRFLRKELGLSQPHLADLFGNDAQAVAKCEKTGRIPVWADRLIRLIYQEHTGGNVQIVALIKALNDLDTPAKVGRMVFEDAPGGWQQQAA